MKQCLLIIGVIVAYLSSFANEMTSYTTRTRNSTTTRTYIGEWERIGNNLWRIPTGTGHCDIDTQSDTKKHRIYVRDHLGSTRAVIDDAGALLQTVNYYASGVPFTLTQGETATDRLHSGKQFIDHQGLGYYDNSARMLDVLGNRFTTLDPMATDYGHLSPYTYCAGNPLKYTDPDGRDIWRIDNTGKIHSYVKDSNVDRFVMVDQFNNALLDNEQNEISISFKYGTIISQDVSNYKGYNYDVYAVRGDENAQKLFEFMSQHISGSPSKVEVGLTQAGLAGDKGLNFITNSHLKGSEAGMSGLFYHKLGYGYTIRRFVHSHPLTPGFGKNDSTMVRDIIKHLNKNNWYIAMPAFHVYHVDSKAYIKYKFK